MVEHLNSRQPADIALALAEREEHVVQVLLSLPVAKAGLTLYKLAPVLRRTALAALADNPRLPSILDALDSDEAADLLLELPEQAVDEVLARLSKREDIRVLLHYPADSAGGIMDRAVLVLRDTDTAADARRSLREQFQRLRRQAEAYVVDKTGHLQGTIELLPLLVQPGDFAISQTMDQDPEAVPATLDREEVVNRMERYDLDAMPVVDEEGLLLGRVSLSDAISVLREESEEDLRYMSGLSQPSSTAGRLMRQVQSRLPWLVVGMLGSILGALVIIQFEGALAQAALLAAFIPLIAASAGNAGIQSSTVTVRGLATGGMDITGLFPRLAREAGGALLNGATLSLLLVLLLTALQWIVPDQLTGDVRLFATLACSMLIVITLASLIGAAVPLLLKQLGIDPAVATGPFITVSNDIIGVWVYFTVANWLYL